MTLSDIQPYDKLPFQGVQLPAITVSHRLMAEAGCPINSTNAEFLRQLCRNGFKTKLAALPREKHREYGDRVKMELDTIEELGLTNYLVMVWDICRFADEKGIPRGPGRGSVGGSLVSYLTDITDIDPIQNGLFFSRFLSKARAKSTLIDGTRYIDGSLVPDIDCDFSYYRRGEVLAYLAERYPGQTAKLLTTTTFTSKILIKDVLKVYENADEGQANAASDLIEKKHGNPVELEDSLYGDKEWRDSAGAKGEPPNAKLVQWGEDHEEVLRIAMALSGLNRGEGQHASAVLICHSQINDLMPLQLSSEKDGVKELVSGFDMYSAQEVIIKMDILGLRTLDVIDEACKALQIDPRKIDVHHPSIYQQMRDFTARYGIFQLETFAQGNAAHKVRPADFEQLTAVLAIARPGAFAYLQQFCDYLHDGVYKTVHPLIDDILKPFGGICLYQETYLAMLVRVGMTPERAENARRVLGKKKVEEVPAVKAEIIEVCKAGGHPTEIVDLLLKIAEDSGGYSFNLSHAACYATVTARTLWLKGNHPLHLYWALLRMARNESETHSIIAQIEKEMRVCGYSLLPPDLIKSGRDFQIVSDKSIRFGLGVIRGVSDKNVDKLESFRRVGATTGGASLLDEYGELTATKFEVFQSLKNAGLNIGIGSALVQAGCLEGFGKSRPRLVLELLTYNLLSDKEKALLAAVAAKPEVNHDVLNGLVYLRDHFDDKGKPLIKTSRFETIKKRYDPYKQIYEMNRRNERLANYFYERTVLGYSYSQTLRDIFGEHTDGLISIQDALAYDEEETVKLIGFVQKPEKRKTKAGNQGFSFLLTDETGELTVRFFNDKIDRVEQQNGRLPEEEDLVLVKGSKRQGSCVFADGVTVQSATIYMKLSQLKDAAAAKAAPVETVEEKRPDEIAASEAAYQASVAEAALGAASTPATT